tara:strand:- start:270 stop:938 length:669 start_codon:yes stop_codon:yes gene_type:complete
MKDYYSILQSFFIKTKNQKRLNQLEKIKDNKTELIKLFNMVKPESLDHSINKIKNTMKLSEFKSYIQEEIVGVLREATIETSPEDLAKVKSSADDDDIIKVTENLNPEVIKSVDRFIKGMAKRYDYSEQDAVFAIKAAMKQRDAGGVNEAEDMDDAEMDKKAAKAAKKGDSIATIASKYQKLVSKMKELAREYKAAEGDKKEKIKDQLKDMTKEKKQLEKAL